MISGCCNHRSNQEVGEGRVSVKWVRLYSTFTAGRV